MCTVLACQERLAWLDAPSDMQVCVLDTRHWRACTDSIEYLRVKETRVCVSAEASATCR